MSKKPNLLIAEDSLIFSQGLTQLLQQYPEQIGSVQVAHDYQQTLEQLKSNQIDILILDLNFESSRFDGFTIAKKVKEVHPETKIIILTQQAKIDSYDLLFSEIGVQGYLDKKLGVDETLEAIREVWSGNTYVDRNIKAMLEIGKWMELSKREREIIELLVKGLTQKEIAEQLFISIRTVEKHVENMTKKIGAKNAVQLVFIYTRYKNSNREYRF